MFSLILTHAIGGYTLNLLKPKKRSTDTQQFICGGFPSSKTIFFLSFSLSLLFFFFFDCYHFFEYNIVCFFFFVDSFCKSATFYCSNLTRDLWWDIRHISGFEALRISAQFTCPYRTPTAIQSLLSVFSKFFCLMFLVGTSCNALPPSLFNSSTSQVAIAFFYTLRADSS